MKCPNCNHEWKLPGQQRGGRAKVKKGMGYEAVRERAAAARKAKIEGRKKVAIIRHAVTCGGFKIQDMKTGLLVDGTWQKKIAALRHAANCAEGFTHATGPGTYWGNQVRGIGEWRRP